MESDRSQKTPAQSATQVSAAGTTAGGGPPQQSTAALQRRISTPNDLNHAIEEFKRMFANVSHVAGSGGTVSADSDFPTVFGSSPYQERLSSESSPSSVYVSFSSSELGKLENQVHSRSADRNVSSVGDQSVSGSSTAASDPSDEDIFGSNIPVSRRFLRRYKNGRLLAEK